MCARGFSVGRDGGRGPGVLKDQPVAEPQKERRRHADEQHRWSGRLPASDDGGERRQISERGQKCPHAEEAEPDLSESPTVHDDPPAVVGDQRIEEGNTSAGRENPTICGTNLWGPREEQKGRANLTG